MSDKPKLTRKQQVFVDEYLRCFNAAEAARRAGYSERSAYSQGWENLRKPEIQALIQSRLDEVHMSADEALKLLADQARGDIGEIMEATTFGYNFDMRRAKEIGFTRKIRKVKQKTVTIMGKGEDSEDTEIHTIEIELYDAQSALEKILRIQGKFKEQLEINNTGELRIVVEYANSKNNTPKLTSGADSD
jgi:phage terminase small subunit